MSHRVRWLSIPAVIVAALAAGCSTTKAEGDPSLVVEAKAFMESYARDLRAGNREAIAARYDTRGVHMVGMGKKSLFTIDSLRTAYSTSNWQPPKTFEWEDLSYEAAGPNAVVIAGRFKWDAARGSPLEFSYTSLLVKSEGQLRIRLEHESLVPPPAPKTAADSAKKK